MYEWTKDKPDVPGHYWYKDLYANVDVIEIEWDIAGKRLEANFDWGDCLVEILDGQFAGPIERPR